jgi:malonyl-CoA/methylmalonyl-CoA synthetase
MTANLYDRLRACFPADRATPCLLLPGKGDLSFADVERRTAQIAHRLVAQGVTKGDRVAAQVEKSPEALFLYLACLRAGAAYLPLNTAYTLAELGFFIGDAEPRVVVCDPTRAEAIRALPEAGGAAVTTLDQAGGGALTDNLDGLPDDFATVPTTDDDLAAILYTSGTTGRSKGAMLSHANLASNAATLVEVWGMTADDVLLHALPIYHVHGLFTAATTLLMAGGSMVFLPRFDVDAVLDAMPRCTVMMGVPTFYTRLLARDDFTAEATRHMRLFVSGSAPLLEETFRSFEARTGQRILERYGMTETGMNCSNPLDGERRPGTVGPPLPGVEARVVDDRGHVLPPGETGTLEVRGPNVFGGYWRLPEKTREEFRDDRFFITGDLARIDADGYVSIVGRAKDLIISGGLNVYPKEVEGVLDRLEGVAESAVIGLPDADFGEAVAAVVVPRPGAQIDPEAMIAETRRQLAAFKVPKRVFVTDRLPRNSMGKVQKNVLRATYGDASGD